MTTSGGYVSQKTHYARLGHASQNLIPQMLQKLLIFYEPKSSLLTKCNASTYIKNNVNAEERTKIVDAKTKGYIDFDIPLVYKILRNVTKVTPPTRGWDQKTDPQPLETTLGDDLERCRRRRNYIIHRGNTLVTDEELDEYFDMFIEIAGRIEQILNKKPGRIVSKFQDLKTCCMDESMEQLYLENLQKLAQKAKETEELYLKQIRTLEDIRQEDTDRISKLEDYLDLKQKEGESRENYILDLEARLKQKEMESVQTISNLENTIKSLSIDGGGMGHEVKIVSPPQDNTCMEGENISFVCEASCLTSESTWNKNGQTVVSDRIKQEVKNYKYKLHIPNATIEDSGSYTLTIGNERYEMYLNVQERQPNLVKLRKYQHELAKRALAGENTIVLAGTNAGKTYVAFHIIEDHLLKNPHGKVVFINKTNVLLQQQYDRACEIFYNLHFQGKIYRWDAAEEEECEPFASIVKRVCILFCTPKSLCNHLNENRKMPISFNEFTLIVLDECHHVVRRNPFNELMVYYRRHKYGMKPSKLPQILGLTATPGTNNAVNVGAAVDHLKKLMTNLDVSKLSTVREHVSELLEYTSTPAKETVRSKKRTIDPVEALLNKSIHEIENLFRNTNIQDYLLTFSQDSRILLTALGNPPFEKSGLRYLQWIAETKLKIENIMIEGEVIPRLLHTCMRHLEIYTDCLEINSLLEIEEVQLIVKTAYDNFSKHQQDSLMAEENMLLDKLKDVYLQLGRLTETVENNPDVDEIIKTLEQEFELQKENSRFLIFVKKRVTAKALAERLPRHFRSHHLTGKRPNNQCGLQGDEQQEIMEMFRNGNYMCLVATSVACEGVDIPQCNLMIRYKFRVDEISSYQMRGRVRHQGGKEIIIAPEEDFEMETKNILRQYFMQKATERVVDLNINADIAIAERNLYESEENARILNLKQINQRVQAHYSIHCRFCGNVITDGMYLRHINRKTYIVFDRNVYSRIKRVEVEKVKKFDKMRQIEKAYGIKCGHDWGCIILYQGCKFFALSREKVNFFNAFKKPIKCKKWADFPFAIEELGDKDIEEYLHFQSGGL